MSNFAPENAQQVLDAVAWAVSEGAPLQVRGSNSKSAIGRPVNTEHEINTSNLTGIRLYEPEELILQAEAGTTMAEIEAALDEKNQQLAFEPMDLGPLLQGESGTGTLGGVIAGNLSGPRRIRVGAARDHLLGFDAVSGRGEAFKSGGRVMKNVTGYDLCKLMCGSWGTLGVMTRLTVKVLPRAEKERTVLVHTDDRQQAVAIMRDGLNAPYDVTGACWVPRSVTARIDVEHVTGTDTGLVALRLEGPDVSVSYRAAQMRELLKDYGKTDELHTSNGRKFWPAIRDVQPFAKPGDERVVWRISVAPSEAPSILEKLNGLSGAEAFMDWGGGLVWLALDMPSDGGADDVRAAVAGFGGHATLIRGSQALRGAVPVFQPLSPGVKKLTERIKASFDPDRVLNPGRMYDGL